MPCTGQIGGYSSGMGYVTSVFARKMVAAAGDAIDGAAMLRGAGIDPEGPRDPKAMIPAKTYYGMLERIVARFVRKPPNRQAGAAVCFGGGRR